MGLIGPEEPDQVHLVRDDLAPNDSFFFAILTRLPDVLSRPIEGMTRESSRRIRILAYALLFERLIVFTGFRANELMIKRTSRGKPFLRNWTNLFFNISHSHDVAAVALSPQNIGVDIEKPRPGRVGIAEEYFHSEERRSLDSSEASCADAEFHRIWTLKESYVKATGEGLERNLSSFSVLDGRRNEGWDLQHRIVMTDFHLALCRRRGEAPVDIREWDVSPGGADRKAILRAFEIS